MFYERLKCVLDSFTPKMSFTKLSYKSEIPSGQFSLWKSGVRRPTDTEIEKLASVKELGLDLTTLRKWRAMDEYPEFAELLEYPLDELKAAYELAKEERKLGND